MIPALCFQERYFMVVYFSRSIDSTDGMQPPRASASSVSLRDISDDEKKLNASPIDLSNVEGSVPSESELLAFLC